MIAKRRSPETRDPTEGVKYVKLGREGLGLRVGDEIDLRWGEGKPVVVHTVRGVERLGDMTRLRFSHLPVLDNRAPVFTVINEGGLPEGMVASVRRRGGRIKKWTSNPRHSSAVNPR